MKPETRTAILEEAKVLREMLVARRIEAKRVRSLIEASHFYQLDPETTRMRDWLGDWLRRLDERIEGIELALSDVELDLDLDLSPEQIKELNR